MRTLDPQELAFLNAIREQPRDDSPRLVYADWLDEHGQSGHAEVIRLQCEHPYIPINIGPGGARLWNQQRYVMGREGLKLAEHIKTLIRSFWRDVFLPLPMGAERTGQFVRGLPVYNAYLGDYDWNKPDGLLKKANPFGTYKLTLSTHNVRLWVNQRLMGLVSNLILWPNHRKRYFSPGDMLALSESELMTHLTGLFIGSHMPHETRQVYREKIQPRIRNCFPCCAL